jgi:hypothetical protein
MNRNTTKQKSGRTADGYKHQPAPGKWKCSTCLGIIRKRLLGEAKGRGHANAEETLAMSFPSLEALEQHQHREHCR